MIVIELTEKELESLQNIVFREWCATDSSLGSKIAANLYKKLVSAQFNNVKKEEE